jgi:hypothetical protein
MKLHTFKLRLFVALCTLFNVPITTSLRFIPDEQKRRDDRGRTIHTYEFFGDALHDLHALHDGTLASKEPEHGTYYLAVEVRSTSVSKLGACRKNKDTITVPLPLDVPQGLSSSTLGRPGTAHPAKTSDDEAFADQADGTARERSSGSKAGQSIGPVGHVKVDLSKIGVQ